MKGAVVIVVVVVVVVGFVLFLKFKVDEGGKSVRTAGETEGVPV